MTSVDIESVLIALGISYDVRGREAFAVCPMHQKRTGKPDNSPSWWINLETGMHTCFSCHYKGNLIQLVADINEFYLTTWGDAVDYDYVAAEGWLATVSEISADKLAQMLHAIPTRVEAYQPPVEMSEARLAIFVNPPLDKLEERGISLEAAITYEILWDREKEAWVLPFRNPENQKFLGWQEKGTKARTFMNRPPGLPRSKTLFGVNELRSDVVYVVESPLDCARLFTAGYAGAVAICGSTINEEQVKLIRNADRVIAAFDNPKVDPAGKKASAEIAKWAIKYGMNLSFFNYGDSGKKDPGDLTDEEISWGIANAKSSLYGELAYV